MFDTVVVVCRMGCSVSGSTPMATVSTDGFAEPFGAVAPNAPHPASRTLKTATAPSVRYLCISPLFGWRRLDDLVLVPRWRCRARTELAQPAAVQRGPRAVRAH